MKFKLGLSFIVLAFFVTASFAQTDIQIKKKSKRTLPGMSDLPSGALTPEMQGKLNKMNDVKTTVYLRNPQMRTDIVMNVPNKIGSFEPQTFSTVIQCAQQRVTNFDTQSKKYYQYSMSGQSSGGSVKVSKTRGYITITGSITDTGERAKVFGYNARRLKQTYTFTPSANACLKQKMQVDIDGWYADIPEFSCPMKMSLPEETGGDCIDDYEIQVKGEITGVALKEVKKITFNGDTITTEEEVTELSKVTLPANFFEPPAGYKAGNTLNNSADVTAKNTAAITTATSSQTTSDSLSLPSAGIEKPPVTEKTSGIIRVGVAVPKVITPDSKNDPNAGTDIGIAVTKSLLDSLKSANVEPIELTSDAPESECAEKGCDYIFYASVTQKRGGGMFGKSILMGAIGAASGMIPGVGGIIGATAGNVILGQTMGKMAKAKDEFTLDYKVVGMDNSVLSKGVTKKKTEKDGEDVLTPQLQDASKSVLGEMAKKQPK